MKATRRGLAVLKLLLGFVVVFGIIVFLTHPISAELQAYGVKIVMLFSSPTPAPAPPRPQATPAPALQPLQHIQRCETHGDNSSCLQNVHIQLQQQHNLTQQTLIFQDNSFHDGSDPASIEREPEPEITDEPQTAEAEWQ
jgi:hypothetical protein